MTGIDSKVQPDLIEVTDLDQLASAWARYLASVAMSAAATLVAIAVDTTVNIPNLSLVFVVPVIVAGVSLGLGPSLCSAILGALAFNFFLTEPRYSLVVDDPANVWAIALLFVVGLIASGVAFTSRRRASEAALLRMQAAVLQRYTCDVVAADGLHAVVSITCQALGTLFRAPAVVLLISEGRVLSTNRFGELRLHDAELEAAQSSLTTGTVLRGGVYPHLASRFDFWPVQTTGSQNAVIGLAFDPDERPSAPDMAITVVANVLALAIECQHGRDSGSPQ